MDQPDDSVIGCRYCQGLVTTGCDPTGFSISGYKEGWLTLPLYLEFLEEFLLTRFHVYL